MGSAGCLTASAFAQLLRSVLQELLEEKEVQENLLQVHLNGNCDFVSSKSACSSSNLVIFFVFVFCSRPPTDRRQNCT